MFEHFLLETGRNEVLTRYLEADTRAREIIFDEYARQYLDWESRREDEIADEEADEILRRQQERNDAITSRPVSCKAMLHLTKQDAYDDLKKYSRMETPPWLGEKDDSFEINDAVYLSTKEIRDFDERSREVLILAPKYENQPWRGVYFTVSEIVEWISNPNNIFSRCKGYSSFDVYRAGDKTSALFVRIDVAGAIYYVPYIDFDIVCAHGLAETYVLKETEEALTYIVSFSVMRGGGVVSSSHCNDDTPKKIYRLVPVTRKIIADEDDEISYDFGDEEDDFGDEEDYE